MALPATWTYVAQAFVVGAQASIVIPAGDASIRHILQSIDARVTYDNAAATSPSVNVLDGVTNIFSWVLNLPGIVAPDLSSDEFDSPSGWLRMGSPGTSMTVRIDPVVPGGIGYANQQIIITGYDI